MNADRAARARARALANPRVIVTNRDQLGRALAEFDVERIYDGGRVVQQTVRESRYDPDTGDVLFENRAVNPDIARAIFARCDADQLLEDLNA